MDCEIPTHGAMTATLDGAAWIPVTTSASGGSSYITLRASDCTHTLSISIQNFRGLGTYDVSQGDFRPGIYKPDVSVDLRCDGRDCGVWGEVVLELGIPKVGGRGAVTVTAYTAPTGDPSDLSNFSGKIEGTFEFTLVPRADLGTTGTRVLTDGRFGSGLRGF